MNHSHQYRPEIDGLRALAIVAVLLYHAGVACGGGYVGVDVFFVISGYLITGIIRREMEEGKFSLKGFWVRRARRILPALVVMVLAVLVAGWVLMTPADYAQLGLSAAFQAVSAANFHFWRSTADGYFGGAAEEMPLLHTWSLAIEEQFYVLLPLGMMWVLGRARGEGSGLALRRARWLFAAVLAGSFALSVYMVAKRPAAAFYLLPTRMWELLAGSVAALGVRPGVRARVGREVLAAVGLLLVLVPVFLYGTETPFPGLAAAPVCAGTVMMILFSGSGETLVGKLLANRAAVGIGLISYSLYLWHWPVLVFCRYYYGEAFGTGKAWWCLGVSVVLAVLSWRYVERPFRRARKGSAGWPHGRVLAAGAAVCGLMMAAGYGVYRGDGVPGRLAPAVRQAAAPASKFAPAISLREVQSGDFGRLGSDEASLPVRCVLWGDSHAMMVAPLLDEMLRERGLAGRYAAFPATLPLLGFESVTRSSQGKQSAAWNGGVLDFVIRQKVPDVILVARWSAYVGPPHYTGEEAVRRSFGETAMRLREAGARLWVMRQVPEQEGSIRRMLPRHLMSGGSADNYGVPEAVYAEQLQREQRSLGEGLEGVEFLDPAPYFLKDGRVRALEGSTPLYTDGSHLTVSGVRLLRPMFERVLANP